MNLSFDSRAFTVGPYASNPKPLEQVVQRLCEIGADGIELSGFPPHATLERYATVDARRDLANRIADYGLIASAYAADCTAVSPVAEGNKQEYIDHFRRVVDFCADIGSPAVRVDTVAVPGAIAGEDHASAMDRLADAWIEAAEIAAAANIRLFWEFEPERAFNKVSEIAGLYAKIGHPNFKLLFDTAEAYMCCVIGAGQRARRETLVGGVPEFLKKIEHCVGAVHVGDSDGVLFNGMTRHCAFDEGCLDFRILAPQLLDLEGIEWWCIDLTNAPDAWELMEPSLDFVATMLDTKTAA